MNFAKEIYNAYSGKTYSGGVFDGVDSYNGSNFQATAAVGATAANASSTGEKASMGGLLSSIGSIFSSAFGKIFGGSDSDTSTASTSGTTTGSTSSSSGPTSTGTAVKGEWANGFPYYNQGEDPWGSQSYTSTGNTSQTIKSSGCGPTSMAMVMKSYGNSVSPSDAANFSLQNGFRTANDGTSWGFFKSYANTAGLTTDEFTDKGKAKEYLDKHIPLIASMGPGDFTKGGHYIVMSKKDGSNLMVNDPASRSRTGSTWDIDNAMNQAKRFWAISKDGEGSIRHVSEKGTGNSVGNVNYDDQYSGEGSGLIKQWGAGESGIETTRKVLSSGATAVKKVVSKASMSKETAVLLKVIIELVGSVVENTAKIDDILEVVKEICENTNDPKLKAAAGKIGNAESSYIPRSSTNQRTLDSLNDLRDKVESIIA